jgi:hypothetical protein
LIGESAGPQRRKHRRCHKHNAHSTDPQAHVQLPGQAAAEHTLAFAEPHVDANFGKSLEELQRRLGPVHPYVAEEDITRTVNISLNDLSHTVQELSLGWAIAKSRCSLCELPRWSARRQPLTRDDWLGNDTLLHRSPHCDPLGQLDADRSDLASMGHKNEGSQTM